MVVVLILGLLIAISIPNFITHRRKTRDKLCQNNLRLIYHALAQYKTNANLPEGVDASAVYNGVIVGETNAYIEKEPLCPIENRPYNVTTFDARPTCPNRDENPTDLDYKNHILN